MKITIETTPKYEICPICGRRVQVNKPLLGSLHFCLSEKELSVRKKFIMEKMEKQMSGYKAEDIGRLIERRGRK